MCAKLSEGSGQSNPWRRGSTGFRSAISIAYKQYYGKLSREVSLGAPGTIATNELEPIQNWLGGFGALREMLRNYYPIYKVALDLQALRRRTDIWKDSPKVRTEPRENEAFQALLETIQRECLAFSLIATAEMAGRIIAKPPPETYTLMFADLDHLEGSLGSELKKEALFRIPPERKDYFEREDLFGSKVSAAFPSCERDIRKAGSCYSLEQEDACVHHLMLVLERGLNALAAKVGVLYQRTNWQPIIDQIASKLRSAPRGPEREFYLEVNAQFGFLKDAYRNHSEHARDDHYDMPKALSILNHVRAFMQELAKGGLTE